ncbi:hypothetical protein QFC21_004747 [Naganishia friedmannii]|uniref:Uncharacterized protein n=1 Tax=Naganishia friedmannii TaxID=89922 RepID=A0ACC2VFE6_9TREE|nr:hypothetical protein QFC21_004747 [Naganishia friedmannii]
MATKILSPKRSSTTAGREQHATRGRSYLLPENLPAKPTDDDLNALEQYLSRFSGSTETLHQGLAKAYLPFVLRNGATSVPHQETFKTTIPIPFPHNSSEEEAQRLALSAHLAAFPGFENYPPLARKGAGGIPTSNSPGAAANRRRAPDIDKESIAPSQLLSQIASRQRQPTNPDREANPPLNHSPPPADPAVENRDSKQGTPSKKEMALLDWARGVSGPLQHHQRATTPHPSHSREQQQQQTLPVETAGSVVMSPGGGSRMGGTNVDDAGDRSSGGSSTTTEGDQPYFAGAPAAPSQLGANQSFTDAAHEHQQSTGYNPHYLHPGSFPFPQHEQAHEQDQHQQRQQHGLTPSASASQYGWQSPAITDRLPRDDEVSLMERSTVGGTTLGGLTTAGGVPFSNMSRMRSALEHELEAERRQDEQVRHTAQTAQHVAATSITHLQSEIRSLQARIIAEHVSRSTLERNVADKAEQAREYRTELASAVRALRRAKEETKKLDEERRKGVRLYEETRERLVKYHEALKVQEARDAGREEGRLEAFHEIERWMTAPPIPIEPLGTIPPMMSNPAEQSRNLRPTGHDADQEDRRFASQQGQRPPPPNRQYASDSSPEEQTRQRGQTLNKPQFGRTDSDQDPRLRGLQRPPQEFSAAPGDYAHQQGYRGEQQQQQLQRSSPGQGLGFVPLRQTPPAHPDNLTPHNAADAYLDRVQHDPRLQGMLAGAPARSFPMTSTNICPTPHGSADQRLPSRRPSSTINPLYKPLPLPQEMQHRRYVSDGGLSQFAAGSQGGSGRRTSIRSGRHHAGLHHREHRKGQPSLSQPDRYPTFPRHQAESILDHAVPVFSPDDQAYRVPAGYVDPRHIPLPETVSEFGTVVPPGRQTTGPSFVSQNGMTPRSRLAVGLRNEDDLSMIDERDERSVAQERSPTGLTQDLDVDLTAQAPPSRANIRVARSMQSLPSWKPKPKLIMPKRLGGAGTDIQDMPEVDDDQLRAMYARDNMVHNAIRMPPDADTRRPGKSQSMYMPPDRFQSPGREERSHATNVRTRQKAHTDIGGSFEPNQVPFLATRTRADFSDEAAARALPPVSVIDFALTVPLPASRAATVIDDGYPLRTTVETVVDREAPHHGILKQPSPVSGFESRGRRKTSTFVTIESVPR